MPSLTWINQNPTDIKIKELERAKALVHAARASHAARLRRKATARCCDVSPKCLCSVAPVARQLSDAFRAAGLQPDTRTRKLVHTLTTAWAPSAQDVPLPAVFVRYITDPSRDESSTAEAMLSLLAAAQRGVYSPVLGSEILRYKNQVMLRLRNGITAGEAPLTSMVALFTAATLDDNPAEARIHSQALRRLFIEESKTTDIFSFGGWDFRSDDQSMLNASVMGQPPRPPGYSGLITSPWLDFIRPLYQVFDRSLDTSVKGTLREITRDRLANIWLWCRIRSSGVTNMDGLLMLIYVSGAMHSTMLRLNDHIARLEQQLNDPISGKTPVDRAYLHTQLAASFGYLAYSSLVANNSRAGSLIAHTRRHLEGLNVAAKLCMYGVVLETEMLSNKLLLFIYWVGACWEHSQMTAYGQAGVHLQNLWFTKGFLALASALKVRNWQQAREILNTFSPCPLPPPYGSDWFDQALHES